MRDRECFRVNNPSTVRDKHIQVAITSPGRNANQILVVSITTWMDWKDQSCVIEANEYADELEHKSCIYYRDPMIISVLEFRRKIERNKYRTLERISQTLLTRIQKGGLKSIHLSNEGKALLRAQGVTL